MNPPTEYRNIKMDVSIYLLNILFLRTTKKGMVIYEKRKDEHKNTKFTGKQNLSGAEQI